jgi:hypothetical protein
VLVDDRQGLRDRSPDVATVEILVPEVGEAAIQAGIADCRGSHINAAAPGAEVEGGPDDRDLLAGCIDTAARLTSAGWGIPMLQA